MRMKNLIKMTLYAAVFGVLAISFLIYALDTVGFFDWINTLIKNYELGR